MSNTIHENFQAEVKTYLPTDQVEAFLVACRVPLKKSISINHSKISKESFLEITKDR
jgi:16S rRNA C967 or C1407 C5-methylase (RsmB/RsmF family)